MPCVACIALRASTGYLLIPPASVCSATFHFVWSAVIPLTRRYSAFHQLYFMCANDDTDEAMERTNASHATERTNQQLHTSAKKIVLDRLCAVGIGVAFQLLGNSLVDLDRDRQAQQQHRWDRHGVDDALAAALAMLCEHIATIPDRNVMEAIGNVLGSDGLRRLLITTGGSLGAVRLHGRCHAIIQAILHNCCTNSRRIDTLLHNGAFITAVVLQADQAELCVQRKHAMATLGTLCGTADGVSRVLSCQHFGAAVLAALSQTHCDGLRSAAVATLLHVVLPVHGGGGKGTADAGVTVRAVGLLQVTGIADITGALTTALERVAEASVYIRGRSSRETEPPEVWGAAGAGRRRAKSVRENRRNVPAVSVQHPEPTARASKGAALHGRQGWVQDVGVRPLLTLLQHLCSLEFNGSLIYTHRFLRRRTAPVGVSIAQELFKAGALTHVNTLLKAAASPQSLPVHPDLLMLAYSVHGLVAQAGRRPSTRSGANAEGVYSVNLNLISALSLSLSTLHDSMPATLEDVDSKSMTSDIACLRALKSVYCLRTRIIAGSHCYIAAVTPVRHTVILPWKDPKSLFLSQVQHISCHSVHGAHPVAS
eukprot:m.1300966 g.1300966  ORF g.1300966 m.1300966 type:complete len:597 (-) comp24804_c0_seq27:1894-3684(-)